MKVQQTDCRICGAGFSPFISFGPMPLGNGFRDPASTESEYMFELAVGFCERCTMVQLTEQPDAAQMFHENYAFFSSLSSRMRDHFRAFAESVQNDFLSGSDPFVVEMGSNDGIMLQHFASREIRHLGIEPSLNVAEVARGRGINTITEYFDRDLAQRIVDEHGTADAFLAANVMCHIGDLNSVGAGISLLLKPKGVLVFEDPYLGDIVEKTSYDQIYDEHAFYFSVSSITVWLARHSLELIAVVPQEVHGGSMRYIVAHQGAYAVGESVIAHREKEERAALSKRATFDDLRKNIERSRDQLVQVLREIRSSGKRIVGYGATSKSTTVINYCGLTPQLVEFICDTTPVKQGKVTPGGHIPVFPHSRFAADYPEYALLFAWNHAGEIMAKEGDFLKAGGKWITYVPSIRVSP